MNFTDSIPGLATWVVTGLGFGLYVWSWIGDKDAIARQRFQDCGVVMIFSAVLTRIVMQQREMNAIDWALAVISPIFIVAALWRLGRTSGMADRS